MNAVFPRFSSLPQSRPIASGIPAAPRQTTRGRQQPGSLTVRFSVADHAYA
jgi:hypothetical protein